ncbi:type II secretion system protein GspM [Pseudomonas sp. NPDC090755]|uniref:type II secretion system protein GspM n=1 Tax=Pseudomonas sp. NPDC090755 TaxID=3364481 RepID=UPI00383A4E38
MSGFFAPLYQHWQRLHQRERVALSALGLFVSLVLFWMLIWQPQRNALLDAERRYQQGLQLQVEILNLPQSVANQQADQVVATTLPSFLARTSDNVGVVIERMEGDGSGSMSLSLGGTLDSVLKWLEKLEASGVAVTALGVEVSPSAEVKATLAVQPR